MGNSGASQDRHRLWSVLIAVSAVVVLLAGVTLLGAGLVAGTSPEASAVGTDPGSTSPTADDGAALAAVLERCEVELGGLVDTWEPEVERANELAMVIRDTKRSPAGSALPRLISATEKAGEQLAGPAADCAERLQNVYANGASEHEPGATDHIRTFLNTTTQIQIHAEGLIEQSDEWFMLLDGEESLLRPTLGWAYHVTELETAFQRWFELFSGQNQTQKTT